MAVKDFNGASKRITIEPDYKQRRLLVHTGTIPLLKADHETNTFIIDRLQLDDDEFYDVRDDLLGIDAMPVQHGQFCFLVYEGGGDFVIWSSSYNYDTGIVCTGFKNFGYGSAVVTSPIYISVKEKHSFALQLKHGY